MKPSHAGMRINEGDWSAFIGHLQTTLETSDVPLPERDDVIAFVESTKSDIVE